MKTKRFRFTTLWLTGLLLAALTFGVCSCSSIDTQTTKYAGAPQPPPTQPATVRILRFEPAQPYQQLGEIVLNIPDTSQPHENVEDKLKQEAAKLGADAVVVVDARIQQEGQDFDPNSFYNYEAVMGEKVVAKAIKYEALPVTGRTQ
jgi:hypothetical protein